MKTINTRLHQNIVYLCSSCLVHFAFQMHIVSDSNSAYRDHLLKQSSHFSLWDIIGSCGQLP